MTVAAGGRRRLRARRRRGQRRSSPPVKLEAQEMHRRGLVVVLALQVLVGDRVHPARSPRPASSSARSMPRSSARRRARSAGSANSISSVAFSCCRPGSADCRRRVPPAMPSGSKMRSTRSISCTWYCTVQPVLEAPGACSGRRSSWRARLCSIMRRAERRRARARTARGSSDLRRGKFLHSGARRMLQIP